MRPAHHHPLRKQLAKIIASSFKTCFDIEVDADICYQSWTYPPKKELGDLAFPMFSFAKLLKENPASIAQKISEDLQNKSVPLLESVSTAGPYVNITFSLSELSLITKQHCREFQSDSHPKLFQDAPKTMIEYSQPNTHKELHVGHMRNLCLGDALVRLFRKSRVETLAVSFPGDVGTHVAKCLWYLQYRCEGDFPQQRKGQWLGSIYTLATQTLENEKESESFEDNKRQLTEILKQIHDQEGPFFEVWKKTRAWSIETMEEVYRWANVSFDKVFWESDVDGPSVELVKSYFAKGLLQKSEGAVGLDLSEQKLGFCLLLKSDGNGLYATKDLELAKRKFEDYNIEKSIYIVDQRQSLHFKQVFAVLQHVGFEQAKDCFHLAYDFVELPDGAMSSRKGNIVPLDLLIEKMEEQIIDLYLQKYRGEWDELEITTAASLIAKGAIKFGMNRIDPAKKIVFKMEDWLKLDGESGPYLQYVVARISSLLKKSTVEFADDSSDSQRFSKIDSPAERRLILQLGELSLVVQQCVQELRTSPLCSYLYHLGKLFNSFYVECPVLSSEKEIQKERLALCLMTKNTLTLGLSLLGISCPARM